MKITITTAVLLCLIYLIGCSSVSPPEEFAVTEVAATALPEKMPTPPIDEIEQDDAHDWDGKNRAKFKVKLLEIGEFHAEDVEAKTGETWLGLFKQGNNYSLISTEIKVSEIPNPDLFDTEVKINRKDMPVFLLKNADFLKQSKVKTIFQGEKGLGGEGDTEAVFDFNGKNYRLWVEGKEENKFLGKGSKLLVSNGVEVQEIRHLKNGCNDCYWHLYWVGDLDDDDKLDFYMNLSDHYNVIDRVLFLSSQAENKKLVKAVAVFGTVGC